VIIDNLRKNGAKILMVKNLEPTLEDVFLHITGREVKDVADQKMPLGEHRRFGRGFGGASRGRGR
jgi:hypothetical protein